MEFSMNAVVNKMILIILLVAMALVIGGYVFYMSYEAIPFAVGVAMGAGVNVVKILWLKKSIDRAVTMDPNAATLHLKGQYFLRLMLTLAVLLIGGFLHGTYVNVLGIGLALLLTLPIASYAMRLFIPKDEHTEAINGAFAAPAPANHTQDTINQINALASLGTEIGAVNEVGIETEIRPESGTEIESDR